MKQTSPDGPACETYLVVTNIVVAKRLDYLQLCFIKRVALENGSVKRTGSGRAWLVLVK